MIRPLPFAFDKSLFQECIYEIKGLSLFAEFLFAFSERISPFIE